MNQQRKHISDRMTLLGLMITAIAIMWNPFYLKQELNLFEWGLYLPGIDAVMHGQVPYRDFFHLRGPFELYASAIFMKIFGFRADVLAAYFYFGTALTICAAVLIAYELIQQRFLLYSFVLVMVTRTFPRVVFTFWGGMRYAWGLLAIWCLVRFLKTYRPSWLFAGGCLAAIGAWTSIEIGVAVLFAFMVLVSLNRECRQRAWLFICGMLIISAPYIIYLLIQNALMPCLNAQWVVLTRMGNTFLQINPVPDTFAKFLHAVFFPLDNNFYQMTPIYCYIFFFFCYCWRMFNKKSSALGDAALAVAVYSLVLFLAAFRNLWASEYEMSLQPEKIVLFYLLAQVIIWLRQKQARSKWVGTAVLTAVILSSLIYSVGRFKTRFYKASWMYHLMQAGHGENHQELINGASTGPIDLPRVKHMTIPVWQVTDLEQLNRFINEHVPARETVWMYPELGSLNFILQRPWVGRFPMATLSWMDEGWFAEYAAALEANPPRYAIVNRVMPSYFNEVYFLVPANYIKHERMMRFLYNHYMIIAQTPTYFIYRRKD